MLQDDYSHNRENLWEDNASFSQVLVQNSLVKVISGIFDLSSLEKKQQSVNKLSH